jgi:hypothetical protein
MEENTAFIRGFVETVWNGRNADALGEFHAAEFTQHGTTIISQEAVAGDACQGPRAASHY